MSSPPSSHSAFVSSVAKTAVSRNDPLAFQSIPPGPPLPVGINEIDSLLLSEGRSSADAHILNTLLRHRRSNYEHYRERLNAALLRLERARLIAARSVVAVKLAQMEERAAMLRLAADKAAAAAVVKDEEVAEEKKGHGNQHTTTYSLTMASGRNGANGRGSSGGDRAFLLRAWEPRFADAVRPSGSRFEGVLPVSEQTESYHRFSDGGDRYGKMSLLPRTAEDVALLREYRRIEGRCSENNTVRPASPFHILATSVEMQEEPTNFRQGVFPEVQKRDHREANPDRANSGVTTQRSNFSHCNGTKSKKDSKALRTKGKSRKVHKKKPIDMPRRALSAYNLFFAEERRRIIGVSAEEGEATTEGGDKVLCADMTRTIARSRLHRKSHGRVGFRDLTKIIAARWKELSPERRERYDRLAAEDARRHKRAMEEYYARQRQREEDATSAAEISADAAGDK